jgi:hypothetical protein
LRRYILQILSKSISVGKNFRLPQVSHIYGQSKIFENANFVTDGLTLFGKMSFDNARAECNKLKMDLVRAQTPEENMCIQLQIAEQGEKFNDLGIINFWCALADRFGERVHLDGSEQNTIHELYSVG